MRNLVDPKQNYLFDPEAQLFSPVARKRIEHGWQGLFRHAILELLPADAVAQAFDEDLGRPTKELYSMAGLVFIAEFNNWTAQDAADAYMFRMDIQYALNLGAWGQSMTSRTVERYQRLFREDNLAQTVMDRVTGKLVQLLELDTSKQRLDSTHVYSNMALFGRTRLMGVTVRRFLVQVKRHDRERYDALPEELRERYGPSEGHLFGHARKDAEKRRVLRQQIAEDMHLLLGLFETDPRVAQRSTFKALVRVFGEQCEVLEEVVTVRQKAGPRCMQNPSDPDATYDGHKGSGYQAQLAETCSEKNEVELITHVIPETAADADSDAVCVVLEALEQAQRKPGQLLADTAYGSDKNVTDCAENGVELVAPVKQRKKALQDNYTVADFDVDEDTHCVHRCPAGHEPNSTSYNAKNDTGRATFPQSTCEACPERTRCCVGKHKRHYRFKYSTREQRNEARREHQKTDEFKKTYRKRAGIEGTNSALKRTTGFGRLRVRGSPAVFMAVLLKAAGYNVLQACRSKKARAKVAQIIARVSNAPTITAQRPPFLPLWLIKTYQWVHAAPWRQRRRQALAC